MENLIQAALLEHLVLTKEIAIDIVNQFKDRTTVKNILKVLKVKKSTYYYWTITQPKRIAQQKAYQEIVERVENLCSGNDFWHGYRTMRAHYNIKHPQEPISHRQIRKIMKENHFQCVRNKKKPQFKYDRNLHAVKNLIKNNFQADRPYEKLFTDLTEFKILGGKIYLSTIIDSYSNFSPSYKTSPNANHKLIYATFQDLKKIKQPCIVHSDQGTVYRSVNFQNWLKERKFVPSMSAKASPSQNAPVESLYSVVKSAILSKYPNFHTFTYEKAEKIIHNFMKHYNKKWLLAKFNYQTPYQVQKNYYDQQKKLKKLNKKR
ncbi:IS3 family transposase [Candidatus Phytoplasma pruni]|uniref:IS3 family transposase n=1 Tax=Candidatus Phytoplasma pruni TaxID=479893 RepID=A0A851HJH7_9MOLU|nr:IS3 family transposase [Candidatus Phytoplasma pruni]NWN45983.1 IS3 family transposase [Candidatus Phytoplasma pruni]